MAESYEDFGFRRLRVWARNSSIGEWADKFTGVIFGVMDLAKDAAFEANKVGLIEHCPTDAVEPHGRARMLEKLSDANESLEAYRDRVQAAWDFWPGVTTTPGLRSALVLYGEDHYIGLEVLNLANDN